MDENDRASATTGPHQDSRHRQEAYMSQIWILETGITTDRENDKEILHRAISSGKRQQLINYHVDLFLVLLQFARSGFPLRH